MEKITIKKLPKSELEILITIPWEEIKQTYEKVLEEATKTAQIKGFREGKAPKKLVEAKLDKTQVYSEVIQKIIPKYYEEAIKENNLKPIISPKISLTKATEGEDWEIKILTCEKPTIELGNYKEELKKILKTEEIWIPGKDKKESQKDEKTIKEEKTQRIIRWFLENIKFEISDLLLEEEVNRRLANLIDQTERLGLTVDQYLTSSGKSVEQLKEEYRQQAREFWKLELILGEISEIERIIIEPKEIDEVVQKAPEDQRKVLDSQKYVLASILRRQKTLDFLVGL